MVAADTGPASTAAAEAFAAIRPPWYRRFTRWSQTSRDEAVAAETRLFALTGAKLEAAEVPVGPRKDEFMNTVVGGPADAPPLVMIPGYGAGIGFFFRNIASLAEHFRVHAVDLLGTGMSGRPPFHARTRVAAEDFFLESLARWREAMGLGKMVLMGHSLGGYLSARYALKYPEHVQHLILVCPAGVSNKPEDWQPPEPLRARWTLPGMVYRTIFTAWESGVTPGSVIRTLGPWGSGLIQRYVRNRFREGMGLTDEETAAFEGYFYHITASRGSGEYALRHLLGPFAWAREPLEEELKGLKVPVTIIYGDTDWMDPAGAHRAVAAMAERQPPTGPGEVITIKDAGHYAFISQPHDFLGHVMRVCKPYLSAAAPQVADAAKVSPARFPADARNLRHFPGGVSHTADAAGHMPPPRKSPLRTGSGAVEELEEEIAHRTEL